MSRYYSSILNVLSPAFSNRYSLNFDGVDDRVELSSNFVASGEFTISFWMYPNTITGNGSPYVIGRFPLLFNNYIKLDQLGVIWILIDQTLVKFLEGTYGGGANNIILNQWQNIIITRDSSNGLRCYRNGADYGYSGTPITNSSTLTLNSIGRNYSNTYGYNGGLDEIVFWNSDQTANISTISTSPVEDLTSLSPVAWYRNGDNGTWKSPQWLIPNNENKTKFSNYSFSYDGVNDYINTGTNSLIGASTLTISAWFKSSDVDWQYLLGDNSIRINIKQSNGDTRISFTGSVDPFRGFGVPYSVGNWNNIILTFDGSLVQADRLKLYHNGVEINNINAGTPNTTLLLNTAANFMIGRAGSTSSNPWNGNIDEVAYWDSVEDASTIYNSGTPNDISSLSPVGYWRSENSTFSTNWTVTDNGSGSNDGTSANMTVEDRLGDAPNSTSNAVSLNMDEADRVEDVPS